MENVTFQAGEEMTVLTRRGVEPSFSDEVTIQSSERNFFFNEYTIRAAKKNESFSIQLEPEFRQSFTFWIYGCSFLFPFLLSLFFKNSYIWTLLLCIFLPTFLSVAGTTAVYQWTINREEDEDTTGEPEMTETGFLIFTKREKIGISLLVVGSFVYFFMFFLLPLSLYVKIVDKWYLFVV